MYEAYDIPDGHAAHATGGGAPDIDVLLGHPYMIVSDFAGQYGIRLHQVGNALPWVEFEQLLYGLLAYPTSRLYRRFPPQKPQKTTDDHEGGDV